MVFALSAALGITLAVPQLRQRESFVLFFGAVTLSSWYGGRGPGLLSCVVAGLISNYFIFEPAFAFAFTLEAIVPLLVFVFTALAISSLTSELARAEQRNREQWKRFEQTFKSIGDAVIVCTTAGVVEYANRAAEVLLGCPAADIAGRAAGVALTLRNNNHAVAVDEPIFRVVSTKQSVRLGPGNRIKSRAGSEVPVEADASPIIGADGRMQGVVLVLRNVSEREKSESQILDYQVRLRSLASEVLLAEERERHRIAIGLHDHVGQTLAASNIRVHTLLKESSPDVIRRELSEISKALKDIISVTRTLTFELSPPTLYEFGLEAALKWLTDQASRKHNLSCTFVESGKRSQLPVEFRVVVFQAARELLMNVIKHAEATQATVTVKNSEDEISISVEDDGVGFNLEEAPTPDDGFGLFSIRERLHHLGGGLDIQSKLQSGTKVSLSMPLKHLAPLEAV